MIRTRVIQSHRQPLPAAWYQRCVDSVAAWAERQGFEYLWLGDELFERLPAALLRKTAHQPVVASDLARLAVMREALAQGFEQVIWFDADTLIIDPRRLQMTGPDHQFGREIWVQHALRGGEKPAADTSPDRLKVYSKIHNAFLCFGAGNPVLDFYWYAAQRLVAGHQGPMVNQLVGPKFLATLHNLLQLPVLEPAAVLAPLVTEDLLSEHHDGAALQLFRRHSRATPAALNLCGSMVVDGSLRDQQMEAVIDLLTAGPDVPEQLLSPIGGSESGS